MIYKLGISPNVDAVHIAESVVSRTMRPFGERRSMLEKLARGVGMTPSTDDML